MRVFLSASSFFPEAGGPARSVPQLAMGLAAANVEVALWAPDGSAISSPLLTQVKGIQRLGGSAQEAWNGFPDVDLLHDNGIWRWHHRQLFKLAKLNNIPCVVSPRGMLEPWALSHKASRKKLAWLFYQRNLLRSASILHATAESEANQFQCLGLNGEPRIIPNGVALPDWTHIKNLRNEVSLYKTCLFMSRLHPKKGLPLLLEAWARLCPKGWRLDIVGPDEAGHRAELDLLIHKLGIESTIRFLGPLEGSEKQATLAQADLFVLPTHSENFGIVVAEALAHGCPVIATHGAPWAILEQDHCGWWVPVSIAAVADALKAAMALSVNERREMGDRGRSVVEREFSWPKITEKFIELYGSVIYQDDHVRE